MAVFSYSVFSVNTCPSTGMFGNKIRVASRQTPPGCLPPYSGFIDTDRDPSNLILQRISEGENCLPCLPLVYSYI
jgi:hypothetical protein